jgi:DNA-binding transcriptional ArsR family regulator
MSDPVQVLVDALTSDLWKALSEPARVALIEVLLTNGPSDVGDIAKRVVQDRSVVSRHLQIMERAGLVRSEKTGRRRVYHLEAQALLEQLHAITHAVQRCC